MWLTTLSTVLAVATGMFTLRNQIFPNDSGVASASPAAFEESVSQICSALNDANAARPREARALESKLRSARTTTDARNALLDTWNHSLSVQQTQLAALEGLDVPAASSQTFHATATAWTTNVARIRGFTQRVDSVSSARDLVAAVRTLPSLRTAMDGSEITTDAGLMRLGDGRCTLQRPPDVPVVTLPASLGVTPSVNATAPARQQLAKPVPHTGTAPAPAAGAPPPSPSGSPVAPTGTHVTPDVVAPARPPVTPNVAPGDSATAGASGGGGAGASGG